MVVGVTIEVSNTCNGASVARPAQQRTSKGSIVISVILLLGTVSVLGIVSSFIVTARDGYRRQPRETFARTV